MRFQRSLCCIVLSAVCGLGARVVSASDTTAIVGDAEFGAYLSSECVACHLETGTGSGIPSITGWPTEAFVMVMRAYRSKDRAHPVMQMIAGRLSDQEIASLALYFESIE